MPGIIFTGNDTHVGKTQIAAALAQEWGRQGLTVQARKPVETGCIPSSQGLMGQDTLDLWQACSETEDPMVICPYRYAEALAPPAAARSAGASLKLEQLLHAAQGDWQADSLVLIETAGGYMSPIAEDGLAADLIDQLQLPVVLVVENRLGAINQCLVHLAAMHSRACQPLAVVLNQTKRDALDNYQDLLPVLSEQGIELLSVPWTEKKPAWAHLEIKMLAQEIQAKL